MQVNDVIKDAHNTFLKDIKVEFNNELALEETQMDLIIKHDNAFNWNDDDEKNAMKIQTAVKRNQSGSSESQARSIKKAVVQQAKKRILGQKQHDSDEA